MQLADDDDSTKATAHLKKTGECYFELIKDGA